jgi:hypothetical protein
MVSVQLARVTAIAKEQKEDSQSDNMDKREDSQLDNMTGESKNVTSPAARQMMHPFPAEA